MGWEIWYYVVIFILMNYLIISSRLINPYKDLLTFIMMIFVSLFLAFRDLKIGRDTENYYDFFERGSVVISEPVFNALKILTGNYYLISFLLSIFSFFMIFYFFKKITNNNYICMGCYVSTFFFANSQLNIVRQGIAVSAISLGVFYILKEKRFVGCLLAIFAVLTHYATLIFVTSLFIGRFIYKTMRWDIGIILISAITMVVYFSDFQNFLLGIASNMAIAERVIWYLTWDEGRAWQIKHVFFISIPLFFIIFLHYRKKIDINMMYVIYVVACCFLVAMLFKKDEMFVDRIIYYTIPWFVVLVINFFHEKMSKNLFFLSCLIFSNLWLFKTAFFQIPEWFIYYE